MKKILKAVSENCKNSYWILLFCLGQGLYVLKYIYIFFRTAKFIKFWLISDLAYEGKIKLGIKLWLKALVYNGFRNFIN